MISEDQLVEADEEHGVRAPGDRIGAFAAYTLAADMLELREIYAGYLQRIPATAWQSRTERRPAGWTLLETLAHLNAAAGVFNTSVEQALAGRPIAIPGLSERSDLAHVNRAMIDTRRDLGPDALADSFLGALERSARLASGLSATQLAQPVEPPYYGGQVTIGELFGAALTHAGIIHGAQVTAGRRAPAIWSFYYPGLMRRQLTRAFHTMGRAYWPERGGSLHATLAFEVAGQGGGSWYVRIDPAGGEGHLGTVRTAEVRLRFSSADQLCRVFTLQTGALRSILLGRLRIRGNLRLAARISRLFSPT